MRTKLARVRVRRNLTQRELSERTGISIAQLRRLERGQVANPPLRYLVNCAWVLQCRIHDLVEDDWWEWLPIGNARTPDSPRWKHHPGQSPKR